MTTLDKVKKQIRDLQENRTKQLLEINSKQEESQARLHKAEKAMRDATEVMNLEAYEQSKAEVDKANIALEMYKDRYAQISKREYISEEESEKVIDSLLDYEKDLESEFISAIKKPIEELQEIHRKYTSEVDETEKTLRTWTNDIRKNYSTRGRTTRIDESGEVTDRSDKPVPIRITPYYGCDESVMIGTFLGKTEKLTR